MIARLIIKYLLLFWDRDPHGPYGIWIEMNEGRIQAGSVEFSNGKFVFIIHLVLSVEGKHRDEIYVSVGILRYVNMSVAILRCVGT